MTRERYKVMLVAGEMSGDLHAGKLVHALRTAASKAEFEFFGAASDRMREAGVEAIVNADNLSVVGLPEIARSLPMFVETFKTLKKAAIERQPDVVVLVDFPDFNLKLAKSLSKRGIKIVYYISPQLWAWRRYRIRTFRRYVNLLISILPFEKEWYAERGVDNVKYVGSPLAREVQPSMERPGFCEAHGLDADRPIVTLLPGSRHKEIVRILPVMLATAAKMAEADATLQFVIANASLRNSEDVSNAIASARAAGLSVPNDLVIVHDETFNALHASDVAAVASGTATLETGIIGTPMAIVYKTSAINYRLLRPLIDVDHFGLINLIAGTRVANELIQDDFTADSLATELFRLLEPSTNLETRKNLRTAANKLGQGGASMRAAELILKLIDA